MSVERSFDALAEELSAPVEAAEPVDEPRDHSEIEREFIARHLRRLMFS